MIKKLKFPGLVPALIVFIVLVAVSLAPATVGAKVHNFLSVAYPAPCATAGLTSDKTSPQPAGTIVTFTGSSTVCPTPEYKFYVQFPNGAWILAQDYDGAIFVWNTAGLAPGTYNVNVWARNIGSTSAVEANRIVPFAISASGTACATAGITSDKPSPQQVDFQITFTGSSTGCSNPEYLFYLQSPDGAWTIARGWNGPIWTWDTSTVASIGNYKVNVWVRQVGAASVQANAIMPYTLTWRNCTAAGLTSDKASPQQVDFTITFTATSASCARPEYLFYLQLPGGAWTIARGWGGPVWAWDTSTVASIGNYNVNVWVRAIGSGTAPQTNFIMPYTLTWRTCSAGAISADKASPQMHGVMITFTGASASCARPEYKFYLKGPGVNGTWSLAQDYDGKTWAWDTSGVASIGTYTINVWVRAIGDGSAYQTFGTMPFTLT